MENEGAGFYIANKDISMGNSSYIKSGTRVELGQSGFNTVKLKGYPYSVKPEWLTWVPESNTVRYGRKEMMSASGDDTKDIISSKTKILFAIYASASFILGFIMGYGIGKESHKN